VLTIVARIGGRGTFFSHCFSTEDSMNVLIGALITFVVVILILYLVNMLPMDGRAKQIVRVVVIVLGIISLLKYLAVF
jgi:hypothetical protein